MRENYSADWAFSIHGAIQNVVRKSFFPLLRSWPLLSAFDFEGYSIGSDHFVMILRDKVSGITCGDDLKPFPASDHPQLPVHRDNVEIWQAYLFSKFSLRPEDAAFILPLHDSGMSSPPNDFSLYSDEQRWIWQQQLHLTISRHHSALTPPQQLGQQPPASVTYNLYGDNAKINVQSTDQSTNSFVKNSPEIFDKAISALLESRIQHDEMSKLLDALRDLKASHGSTEYAGKYTRFMGVLSDHISVFGPILAPYLPTLASLCS